MQALRRAGSSMGAPFKRSYAKRQDFVGMPPGWNELKPEPSAPTPEAMEKLRTSNRRIRNIKYGLYATYLVGMSIGGYCLVNRGPVVQGRVQTPDAPLSASAFTKTAVVSSEESGPDTKIITLQLPPSKIPLKTPSNELAFSSIYSVYIKDDDIQVERAYTPLEGIDEEGNMKFWVKRYPHGEVGRWLHSKTVHDTVEIRAPLKTWQWEDGKWDEIIMISGGTGITPFQQLFHNVISKSTSLTRFTLLHSSRTKEELPPPALLHPMTKYAQTHPERFNLHLFAGDGKPGTGVNAGRIDRTAVEHSLGVERSWWTRFIGGDTGAVILPERKVLFLVCGPEGMISTVAGPYGRNFSQGPVGGILRELGASSNQVRKL